jgi:hypothetical protein
MGNARDLCINRTFCDYQRYSAQSVAKLNGRKNLHDLHLHWVQFPMRLLDSSVDLLLPAALWPWVDSVPGIFLGVKHGWPACKTDSLTAICEPTI